MGHTKTAAFRNPRGQGRRPTGPSGGPIVCMLLMASMLLALTGAAAAAEPKAPSGTKAAPGTPTPPQAAENADAKGLDRPLPEINVSEVSLDDFLAFLQDVTPDFKAMIVRDPDVAPGYPIVTMRLKSVPLGQLLDVLTTAYPEVELTKIQGHTPDRKPSVVYVVKVHASDRTSPFGGRGAAVVKVYRLGGAVSAVLKARRDPADSGLFPQKVDPKEAKEALNQVLSLIKATLSQVETGRRAPTLQVHEETQTLIFRGGDVQRAALEDALAALDPQFHKSEPSAGENRDRAGRPDKQPDATDTTAKRREAELRQELAEAEAMVTSLRKSLSEANAGIADLTEKLRAVQQGHDRQAAPERPNAAPDRGQNGEPKPDRSAKDERAPKENPSK